MPRIGCEEKGKKDNAAGSGFEAEEGWIQKLVDNRVSDGLDRCNAHGLRPSRVQLPTCACAVELSNAPPKSMGLRFKPLGKLCSYHGGIMYCRYPLGHLQLMTRSRGPL